MNSNPQVVKFCNEGVRVAANKLFEAYTVARQLVEVYDAMGIESLLGDDPVFDNWIEDGSPSDGRPQISAGGVKLTIENMRALLATIEAVPENGPPLSMVQGLMAISPRYAN